jgi:hypothetical protein
MMSSIHRPLSAVQLSSQLKLWLSKQMDLYQVCNIHLATACSLDNVRDVDLR